MITRLIFLFGLLAFSLNSFAQTYKISGHVVDANDTVPLIGVSALLTSVTDSSIKNGGVSDGGGDFEINSVKPGRYKLRLNYLGYKNIDKMVMVTDNDVVLATFSMNSVAKELKGVTVAGKQIRAEQKGDTTQFSADAFKTHPDATAEDLVTKMPGVTSDNNGVKVNGESVQQVYVDGKPFFGTDPGLALKNLPAEVIDKIQIFDKMSDQASFTGFDDGNSQKTMNIQTRGNKREGQFGKIYGAVGTDDRYLAGGSFNSFKGDQRISVIGMTNNINQQNFNSQDILGSSGGGGGRGFGGGGGGGMFGGGGGGGNNFMVGQQSGITTTNSAGINYSDQWGPKIKVSASYFFNSTDNTNLTESVKNLSYPGRNLLIDTNLTSIYNQADNSTTKNFNHRLNVRFEYTIDSLNSLIITPNLSLQENYSKTSQIDSSLSLERILLSNALNGSNINSAGYTFSNNLLFQHKMHKRGRTISINVNTSLNQKAGDGDYSTFIGAKDSLYEYTNLDQKYQLKNNGYTVSTNVNYTEPLSKKSQLMFTYNPSFSQSKSDKETDTLISVTDVYVHDSLLSNKYNSNYNTQKGGMSYRYNNKLMSLNIGANYQYSTLSGDQTYPTSLTVNRDFSNILPNAFFNYRYKDGKNLRIMYRTNINAPSISQLQNVIDISNPLALSTGNTKLAQDFEQTLTIRFGQTKSKSGHNFFLYAMANYINNYIGNATYSTMKADSAIGNGVFLKRGGQLTLPVNLPYYSNNRIFVTYGVPVTPLKSNLNFNGGINYTRTPGLINEVTSYSNNYVPNAGVVLSSNISQYFDFTLSYTGNYNLVHNTLQGQANNNYYNHTASFKINYILFKSLVLNTNITNSYYSTLSSSTGTVNFYLWNAYVGYKFLKNKGLEARISAFDILNQNKSVSRIVGANYVESDVTNVLKQYFMFQLTYTLRNFKGPLPDENRGEGHRPFDGGGFRPGPGGPPGGMMGGGFDHNH